MKLTTTAIAWRDHIFAWQASGLSQSEYCSRHKVNINQFWNWKSKFNQAGVTKKIRTKHPTAPFVPVTVTYGDAAVGQKKATSGDSGVSVVINKSIKIHLAFGFDTSVLVTAAKALAATDA